MKILLVEKESIPVIYLQGELDIFSAIEVKKYLTKKIFEENYSDLVLNLEKVPYIDSSGIGILISLFVKNKNNRHIRICSFPSEILALISSTGLISYLNIDKTEEKSIEIILSQYRK
ncbi:MAG: hypothetical protein A2096_00535 [Spirochaetes bacterium GWF1_41_5]|nr:MAG: hypothetical protein A2096_00535 [Spirochaetes bacterium GWF1_41_5]HBE03425.1 hypothetical protein [Spirochaetia bacterium]